MTTHPIANHSKFMVIFHNAIVINIFILAIIMFLQSHIFSKSKFINCMFAFILKNKKTKYNSNNNMKESCYQKLLNCFVQIVGTCQITNHLLDIVFVVVIVKNSQVN